MVFRPLGLQTQSLDPQPSVGTDTGKVEESLRLQVYRSVWGFECDQTLKNPVNDGENELEPVVGIGRFHSMNDIKIADFLRKSTSLTKSPTPSITLFS